MTSESGTHRISRRKFVAWGALVAASAGLAPFLEGCSQGTAPAKTEPTVVAKPTTAAAPAAKPTEAASSGTPTPGGVLRVTLGSDIKTLDPHKQGTVFDWDVLDHIFEGLTDCDLV